MPRQVINVHDELHRTRGYTWSDAARKGNVIAVSGTVATDEVHRGLFPGDLVGQTRHIYRSVEKLLGQMGATFADVIKTTDFVVPGAVAEYPKTADVRREFFQGSYPAATGVVVHSLLSPDWLIEIEFLAVVDADG